MATVIFIALLAIMMMLVTANVRTLLRLHTMEKFVEQKQIQRLDASQTNTVTIAKQLESK
jgi:Tfp pilus assembly protein FimT